MKFVEDEEPKACRLRHQALFPRPGQDELEHHVVREQDVRRVNEDLLALLISLLTGVPGEPYRRPFVFEAEVQELLQLAKLAVGQGVHWIDHDRLDPLARPSAQDMVDDRDDVGEALA